MLLWIVISAILVFIGIALAKDANITLIGLRWDGDYSHGRKFWFLFPDPPDYLLYSPNYTDAMLSWNMALVMFGSGVMVLGACLFLRYFLLI